MTKKQLQQELKDKVKPGVKPSQLKKLKRSKSANDIPQAPPLPKSELDWTDQKQILLDQLKQKQTEIESLRAKLETNPTETTTELDNSLLARHKSLKDWWTQYSKNKQLDTELEENVNEASTELISQDKKISALRLENNQLKLTNQSLSRDLNSAQRLAQLRKAPLPTNSPNLDYLSYGFYLLTTLTLIIWLLNKEKYE